MHDDAELLRRHVRDRSEPAFTTLVQRHLPVVYAVALRRVGHDAHLAEDVAQRVFTDLARKAPSLLSHASLTGWLYVSTHHASAAVVRGEQRRKVREAAALTMQPHLTETSPPADWERVRPLLDELVVDLKTTDREAVVLRFFHRRSFAEIGLALQLTEEAARKRVDRALDRLRSGLARRGVTSTSAALGIVLGESAVASAPAGLALKVAGTALTQATVAVGGTSGLLALLKTLAPTAAATAVGLFFINSKQSENSSLRAELNQLDSAPSDLAPLMDDRQQLARLTAEADDLRRIQAGLPALRAAIAAASPPKVASAQIEVAINAAGALSVNGEPVKLGEFQSRLQALRARAPSAQHTMLILRPAAQASSAAVNYVLDEARKAEISKLTVRGQSVQAPIINDTWF